MKKKVESLFCFREGDCIGITHSTIKGISKAGKEFGVKRETSTVSPTMVRIIDEVLTGKMKFSNTESRYICERKLGEVNYDVCYFSKKEKYSMNSMLLVGGIVSKTPSEIVIETYDLSRRVGTAVLGALFPLFLKNDEFEKLYTAYAFARKEFIEENHITFEDGENVTAVMDEEANRNLALLCDNAYRHIINDKIQVGMEIEAQTLFSNDPVFEEEVKSMTNVPFEIIKNKGSKKMTAPLSLNKPVEWEYSDDEKKLIPHITDYVWNKEIEVVTKAIAAGEKNIILFGGAGTGKSVTTQKIAEVYGLPWVQFSMTNETETIDILGKYVPNTDENPDGTAGTKPYRSIPTPEQMAYGEFSDLYYELTGEKKENADRLDVMTAYQKALLVKSDSQIEENVNKGFKFVESNIVKAIKNGYVLEIEEGNLANVLSGVNSLFDTERGFAVMENGETIHRHPNCIIIMTMNPAYEGTREINEAVKDRFGVKIYIDDLDKDEMIARVQAKGTTLSMTLIEKMADIVIKVNDYKNSNGYTEGVCGLRTLLKWVKMTEVMDGDYKEALKYTVLTSCSMNAEIMDEIYSVEIENRL